MRWPAMAVVPAIPGKTVSRVDPRPALEVGGAGALDDDEARADARDADAPDRAAVLGVPLHPAREVGDAVAHVTEVHQLALFFGRRRGPFDLGERAAQVVLA